MPPLAWLERRLMYFPDARRVAPVSLGLEGVEESLVPMEDGTRLVLWRSRPVADRPTVLYFHGNAGGLTTRSSRFPVFAKAGLGLVMPSYRGYSGSGGQPSEGANVADAEAVLQMLLSEGHSLGEIVLYGESLGTGVAVQLAAKYPVRGLILEAPYSSTVDIGRWRAPLLPIERMMQDRYDSVRYIAEVRAPLLIIHGELDGIIPIRYGRKLFAAANEPKSFAAYPLGHHTDLFAHGAFEAVERFVG